MFCKKCGKEVKDSESFCRHCGEKTLGSNASIQSHIIVKKAKNRSELNQKSWYRLLKVLYIGFFSLIFIFFVFIIFGINPSKFDNEQSYIKCYDGRSLSLSGNNIYLYSDYISTYDDVSIKKMCAYNPDDPININPDRPDDLARLHPIAKNYNLISIYRKTVAQNIWYSIILFFVVLGISEFLKRIFYYIVFGKFIPHKN